MKIKFELIGLPLVADVYATDDGIEFNCLMFEGKDASMLLESELEGKLRDLAEESYLMKKDKGFVSDPIEWVTGLPQG